ncbi:MAG: hypothetical protein KGL37_00655 [Acidobacteriota bacterium]|nr:hypothetical protein [Acidobacteriota bacterium]
MRPQSIGRALGIGVRVATRVAGQRLAGYGSTTATTPAQAAAGAAAVGRTAGQAAGQTVAQGGRGVARGVGGFLRPFQRVGSIVWLEVSGVFFLLFVLVFARGVWHLRANYAQGADHYKFVTDAALMLLFLYLSVSSFWRARRK